MGSKQAEEIKNLLLKIIIPLAFPLAGSFICGLIADRAIRHSDLDSSDNSIQLDQSSSDGLRLIQGEEGGGEMESPNRAPRKLVQAETPYSTGRLVGGGHARQASLTEEIMVAQDTESSSEVSVNNQRLQDVQGTPAGAEEGGGLKRVRKFRKVAKKSRQEFDAIDGRILALDAREAEMAARCRGFEQLMAEMKELVSQLQKGKGTDSESVEVAVERSMRKLSSSKDLLDGMGVLRDRWAADMEELIYLGWITAWLQHDLLVSDGEGGAAKGPAAIGDDDDDGTHPTAEEQRKKGEKMVAVAAPINEVELRKTSSNASSCAAGEESCMGLAGCRTGIGRPRLLRKIRGWAKGKGPSKSSE
ncbi:hypothetical protein TRIUR3_17160 [Triticum urartu]|uniref:Uncharacterized protein n=1 Tax=Triticum urartu TaxID=4572 RepID=M7YII4_TRIUA|nr:hypothetical protein TRIUR3_17160 [Triticum urartu]